MNYKSANRNFVLEAIKMILIELKDKGMNHDLAQKEVDSFLDSIYEEQLKTMPEETCKRVRETVEKEVSDLIDEVFTQDDVELN